MQHLKFGWNQSLKAQVYKGMKHEGKIQTGSLVKTKSYLSMGEIGKVIEIINNETERQYKVMLPSGPMYFYEHELVVIEKSKLLK